MRAALSNLRKSPCYFHTNIKNIKKDIQYFEKFFEKSNLFF